MSEQNTPCCGPTCCGGENEAATAAPAKEGMAANAEAIRDKVREGYGQIARSGQWSSVQSGIALPGDEGRAAPSQATSGCCGGGAATENIGRKPDATENIGRKPDATGGNIGQKPDATENIGRKTDATATGGCCGPSTITADQVATAVGYATADLASIPEGANMGLSCGNPTALASLKPGEVVLDLGAGGGFDCFIAGPKVGATGRVIGVDMTPDMLSKARRNIEAYRKQSGLDNVEFRLGEIEHLPVEDATVDVIISNCVINLSPDKRQVWREIARALKPGGRVAVSDLALLSPLPPEVAADVEALVGCISGASLVDDIRRMAQEAGLIDIELVSKSQYIEAMTSWQDPLYQRIAAALPEGSKMSDYITSLDIAARKA